MIVLKLKSAPDLLHISPFSHLLEKDFEEGVTVADAGDGNARGIEAL